MQYGAERRIGYQRVNLRRADRRNLRRADRSHREHPEDQKAGCVVMSPGHPHHKAEQGEQGRQCLFQM